MAGEPGRSSATKPVLIVIAGLPGTGKSTIAAPLALQLGVPYLRIDTIEQALRDSDEMRELGGAGYYVAMAVARDQLRLELSVVVECVNPETFTRDLWDGVAAAAGAEMLNVEVICSDAAEHERRVTERAVDVPGLVKPTWQQVLDREYEPWDRERLVLDTAVLSAEDAVAQIIGTLTDMTS